MDAYTVEKVSMKDADFAGLSQEILKRGDSVRFKAHGSSMIPLIQDGDLLTIEPLENRSVKRGDVVFYQSVGEKCVVHRVVKINVRNDQCILVMKGDASPGSLEEIDEDLVLGKVTKLHRSGKRISLNRNLWWILSRCLPGFLLFSYFITRAHRKFYRNNHSNFHSGKE